MRSASLRNVSMLNAAPSLVVSPSKARGGEPDLLRTMSKVSGCSTDGGGTSFIDGVPHGMRPPAALKVDDAKLPIPPHIQHVERIGAGHEQEGSPHKWGGRPQLADFALLGPEGSHEWDSLQMAVTESCTYFSTPSAIVAWKKWCLNKKNVSLVVSFFWFVVSEVFLPNHPLSKRGALKEHAISHFSQQYILSVIQFKGLKKDLYNALWQKVLAAAVVLLLKDCFPRSNHKFNDELEDFILGFIRRLVSGTLPGDSHPSLHSHPGQALPAAVTRQQQLNESNDFPPPPPPPPLESDNENSDNDDAEHHETIDKKKKTKESPSYSTLAKDEDFGFSSVHLLGFSTTKPSPVMQREMLSHGLGELRTGEAALKGQRTNKVGGRSQPSYRRPLDAEEGDEVSMVSLARQCKQNASEAVKRYEERRKEMAHEVTEGKRELSLFKQDLDKKVAVIQTNSAIGDDYIPGPDSPAPVTARTLANHLSSYLENDVQRLARQGGWEATNSHSHLSSAFPTTPSSRLKSQFSGRKSKSVSSPHGLEPSSSFSSSSGANLHVHPHLPTYLASTEATHGVLHGSTSSDLIISTNSGATSTRVMAPWSRMRRCEEALSGALSQAKKNSSDVAARVFGSKKEVGVEKKPARGTADIKVKREARMILSGLDLEQYR